MVLLVRTPAPFESESLFAFLLRVAETNGYHDPRAILKLAEVPRGFYQTMMPGLSAEPLAAVLNRLPDELTGILYRLPHKDGRRFVILGHELGGTQPSQLMRFRAPALCPLCVGEDGFISAFWDLAAAVACPTHGTAAVDCCQACQQPVSWVRPGLLRCSCGAPLGGGERSPVSPDVVELLQIVEARLFRRPLSDIDAPSGFPREWLESASLLAVLRLIDLLGRYAANGKSEQGDTMRSRVERATACLANWPTGYHALLDTLGRQSLLDNPEAGGLGAQFKAFYHGMFRSRLVASEYEFFRQEFVRFGVQQWGKAAIDHKLLDRIDVDDRRFVSRTEFVRRHRIWAPTLDRMIRDGDVVAVTTKSGRGGRTVIDTEASRVPAAEEDDSQVLHVREAARRLGLPVAVIRQLRRRRVLETKLRRGRGSTWYEDDVEAFRSRCLALAPASAATQLAVSIGELMQLKFRSAAAKADIVEATINGTLQVIGRVADDVSGLQVAQDQTHDFVLRTRVIAEDRSYSLPHAAKECGISPDAAAGAVAGGLLSAVVVGGRTRVSYDSVEHFRTCHLPLSKLGGELKTTAARLLRLCEGEGIPVTLIDRVGGKPGQPIISQTSRDALLLAFERAGLARQRAPGGAQAQVEAVERYLEELRDTGQSLPRRGGKLNKKAISRRCGFGRHVLSRASPLTKLLDEYDREEQAEGRRQLVPAESLQRYLERLRSRGESVPLWAGRPNKRQIATICGFKREAFRTDPELVARLRQFMLHGAS